MARPCHHPPPVKMRRIDVAIDTLGKFILAQIRARTQRSKAHRSSAPINLNKELLQPLRYWSLWRTVSRATMWGCLIQSLNIRTGGIYNETFEPRKRPAGRA